MVERAVVDEMAVPALHRIRVEFDAEAWAFRQSTVLSFCRNGPPLMTSPTCQRKSDCDGSVIHGVAATTWR